MCFEKFSVVGGMLRENFSDSLEDSREMIHLVDPLIYVAKM